MHKIASKIIWYSEELEIRNYGIPNLRKMFLKHKSSLTTSDPRISSSEVPPHLQLPPKLYIMIPHKSSPDIASTQRQIEGDKTNKRWFYVVESSL